MNEFLKKFIKKLYENLKRQEDMLKNIENDLGNDPCMAIHSYLNTYIPLTDNSDQFILDLKKMWETEIKKY